MSEQAGKDVVECTKNFYKKTDLELIQDSPEYAAELIGRYREEKEMLVGALRLIADDETDWPRDLAKNVLSKIWAFR